MNKKEKHDIIFPNVHEYMRRGMDNDFSISLLSEWRDIAAGYGEVAMFWGGENKTILAPRGIDKVFVDYIKDLLGYNTIDVLTTKNYTSETSKDFYKDNNIIGKIRDISENYVALNFIPWGATEGAYLLINRLKESVDNLEINEIPNYEHYWTSLYFDSKIGFREVCLELSKESKEIRIPDGVVCDGIKEVMIFLQRYYTKRIPCVIKANMGAGGFGNIFMYQEMMNWSFDDIKKHIYSAIGELPYFHKGIVIIEELIEVGSNEEGQSSQYFMSGYISGDGKNQMVGGGQDIRDRNNYYSGVYMGKGVINDPTFKKLSNIMNIVGERLSKEGYIGHWGVNFMLDKKGTIYMIELNPRRCGESHIHGIANKLYGLNWMKEVCVLSRFPLNVQVKKDLKIENVIKVFKKVNNDFEVMNIKVIPTQISWLFKCKRSIKECLISL